MGTDEIFMKRKKEENEPGCETETKEEVVYFLFHQSFPIFLDQNARLCLFFCPIKLSGQRIKKTRIFWYEIKFCPPYFIRF